jgi:hypothetical protein
MIRPLGALDLKHSVLINEELGNAAFYFSFMLIASIATTFVFFFFFFSLRPSSSFCS